MPTDKAMAHQRQIDARAKFFTVQQLAERWCCSASSVRNIPFDRLPYTAIGRGAKREHRRYDPADVERYEHRRAAAA